MAWDGSKELDSDLARLTLASKSLDWPKTQSEITNSRLDEFKEDQSYAPALEYVYEVNGKHYTSKQISLVTRLELYGEDKQFVEDFLRHFPKGSRPTARYNPENPSQTVLIPGVEVESARVSSFLKICIGLAIFLGMSGVAINCFLRKTRDSRRSDRIPVFWATAFICAVSFGAMALQYKIAELVVSPEDRVHVSSTGYTVGDNSKEVPF